jgi:hypothetical protein
MLNRFTKTVVEFTENYLNYEQLFIRCFNCKTYIFLTCKFSALVQSNNISVKALLRIFVIIWSRKHSRMSCLLFDVCGTINFANLRQIRAYLCFGDETSIDFLCGYVHPVSWSSLQVAFLSPICNLFATIKSSLYIYWINFGPRPSI